MEKLCPHCMPTEKGGPFRRCELTNELCPFTRWCPTDRCTVMTDLFKKCGCPIKRKNKTKEGK